VKATKIVRALASDLQPRTYLGLREAVNQQTIRRALADGQLTRLVADQYCLTIHAESWTMRSRAAVEWAGPGAALTGVAALAAFGYAPIPFDLIHVAVPAGCHRSGPPWIKVRSLTMPFQTATWVPVTQMTMPDLALVLGYGAVPPHRRASYVHGAMRRGLGTAASVRDLAETLTRIPAKRELIQRLRHIVAGAESFLEERGMETVFYGAEFAELIFQHRIRIRGEGFRIDAFHPPSMTAFELDGDGTHDEPPDRKRDIRRDALLATIGIATVRLARASVLEKPEWCREIALEAMQSRTNRWWSA
jgi:hypothetical protein